MRHADCYKELQGMCSYHRLEKWVITHIFYNGLNYNMGLTKDITARGALMKKRIDHAIDLIEDMTLNHH